MTTPYGEPVRGITGGATRIVASTIGAFVGVSGIEHGIGEVLQGNVAPPAMVFPAWPESDFFRVFSGEPAFSVVPSLLAAGILTIVVSTLAAIWAIFFITRERGAWMLIGLLVLQFLVGGGIAGIPAGILAALAGTRIGTPLRWWNARFSPRARGALANAWVGTFVLCVAGWLLLFPGLSIVGLVLGVDHPAIVPLIMATLVSAVGFLAVAIITGFARDLGSGSGMTPE